MEFAQGSIFCVPNSGCHCLRSTSSKFVCEWADELHFLIKLWSILIALNFDFLFNSDPKGGKQDARESFLLVVPVSRKQRDPKVQQQHQQCG